MELLGNNAICYQAVQRILRNRLVGYVRARMTEIYPGDHVERLKKPFAQEWDALVASAKACRDLGGTETKVQDEYDLLSVGHFFNVFDAYFDKMYSAAALSSGNYKKPVKAKLLGNLKAIKDGRDHMAHPVQQEISYEEAFGVLTDVKQIIVSLGFDEDGELVSQLMKKLQGLDSPEASRLICNLPTQDSIYLDFVGRQAVLQSLREWFSSPNNKRCILEGDGGKGKSAVAYRFAQELSGYATPFKLIAWLSAKLRKFEGGKVVPIDAPDFTNLESAIDRVLVQYGVVSEETDTFEHKKSRLFQLLNDFPAFLVVDDIDTVLSETELVALFTFEVPSTKSTVLLTSRRDIPGIKSFTIGGFEPAETEAFVKSRIDLYDLDAHAFSFSTAKEIQRVTDGSPLYIDDVMRLARIVPIDKAIEMWGDKKGDDARKYALQRELEHLSTDARKILIAASIGDDPVSFAELESIVRMPEERIVTSMTELQTLFLFPKPRVVEGEQRFEVNSNTRKLVREVERGSDQYDRIETAAKALRGQLPRVGRGIISALIRQAFLLLNNDRYQEAETLLLQAAEKYPQEADLQGFIGYMYRKANRFTDAAKHFEAAYKLKSTNRYTYRHWVKMEMSQREWTRAIAAADKGTRMVPTFYELHALRADAKLRSGLDHSSRLQREKAFRLWSEAVKELRDILKSPDKCLHGEREISADMYKTLVVCLDLLGDYRTLREYLASWLKEHPEDPNATYQKEFIEKKRGMTVDELAALRPELQTSSHPRPTLQDSRRARGTPS